jgi:ATP-dependent helicase/nuclease subunit B
MGADRMDALLLLHPLHKVIGREPKDRGDYFIEPRGRLRIAAGAALALTSSPAVSICHARLFRDSPDGPFSLLRLWHRAEAEGRLHGMIHNGDWFHIGTPQALATAERVLAASMPATSMPGDQCAGMSVFTIAIDRRFADELAMGVLAQYGGDPLALADVLILLPTRRSVRALREAFLRAAAASPRSCRAWRRWATSTKANGKVASGDGSALALPPAIEPAERDACWRSWSRLHRRGQPIAQSPAQALSLARELGRLLDELAIEGISFDRLEGLVEGNFASHWQRTLRFLAIVGEHWPRILADRGQIDAIERAHPGDPRPGARWRERPPATPVIAAGSTGSQPATRELLSVIAGLPQGRIVLPGLDRDMDDRSWMALDETHPQFGLRELLKALGRERRDVADWPGGTGSARHLLITELMRPAETTEEWVRPLASSLEHVTRADCATPHQEALVIALAPTRSPG